MLELEDKLGLVNYDNYGPLKDFPKPNKKIVVNTDDITIDSWDDYYFGIFNIFRDGIEDDIIKKKKIRVIFGDTGMSCNLFITDFLINIELWYLIIFAHGKIKPYHLVKNRNGIQSDDVKRFVDKYFILPYKDKIEFKMMNNIIDDALYNWFYINEFSDYLADTLNLKDTIDLARQVPEYYNLLHTDLSQYNIDEVNNIALQMTDRMMEIEKNAAHILGYDHCMANSHRAGQSPRKQLKEGFIYIGPKPDGNGNVYSHPINRSYINGGVSDIADFFIDSALSRTAQILSHTNVGNSGHFARLLGLNNSGTFINTNIEACNTERLIHIELKTKKHVEMYIDRWCKLIRDGVDLLITKDNMDQFIGKEIWIYSPMTCNSHSHHKGICKKCYGLLWMINHAINTGKISAEILSRILTQILLSAKHILEALVKKTKWTPEFYDYFTTEFNYILIKQVDELKDAYIVIDPSIIDIDNEDDYNSEDTTGNNINEHISYFKIETQNGRQYTIQDEDGRELYISNVLNGLIRRYSEDRGDGLLYVPISKIDEETPIFYIRLLNNELSRLLDKLMAMINKKPITESFTIDQILQEFIDTVVEGKLSIRGIHCEVILSNQIHSVNDIFEDIDWSNPNASYKMVTLKDALLSNPSPTVTLMYQNIAKTLYTPLTYRKHGPSFLDLFFMEHPQKFLNSKFAKSIYDSEIPDKAPWSIVIPPEEKKDNVPWFIDIKKLEGNK